MLKTLINTDSVVVLNSEHFGQQIDQVVWKSETFVISAQKCFQSSVFSLFVDDILDVSTHLVSLSHLFEIGSTAHIKYEAQLLHISFTWKECFAHKQFHESATQ